MDLYVFPCMDYSISKYAPYYIKICYLQHQFYDFYFHSLKLLNQWLISVNFTSNSPPIIPFFSTSVVLLLLGHYLTNIMRVSSDWLFGLARALMCISNSPFFPSSTCSPKWLHTTSLTKPISYLYSKGSTIISLLNLLSHHTLLIFHIIH